MRTIFGASLLRRLVVLQSAVVTLVFCVMAGFQYYDAFFRTAGLFDNELKLVSDAMAQFVSVTQTDEAAAAIGGWIQKMYVDTNDKSTVIMPHEVGYQVWRVEEGTPPRMLASTGLPRIAPGSIAPDKRVAVAEWLTMGKTSADGRIFAVAALHRDYYHRLQRDFFVATSITYLIVLFMLIVTSWLALKFGLKPLRQLADDVANRSEGDYSFIKPGVSHRETAPLVNVLNEKIVYIKESMERERRFFADAAHELRTPLAVLSAQAHLVAHENNEKARMRALEEMESGIERAATVLNKLLTLAKLDGAEPVSTFASANLAKIAAEAISEQAARAVTRNQQLSLDAADDAAIECDASSIRTLIDTLLDNAIRYTPPGGQIGVYVHRDEKAGYLAVEDDGPGIPEADREKVFERFVRLGASEINSSGDSGGSGLGLAIVKRIVTLHDGEIRLATPRSGRGLRVEVRLPPRASLA